MRVQLAYAKSGRPIIYIASATWYGGAATSRCVFNTRAAAVRWARETVKKFSHVDFSTWTGKSDGYPDERQRDDPALSPTWICTWREMKGGRVEVEKTEVCADDEARREETIDVGDDVIGGGAI